MADVGKSVIRENDFVELDYTGKVAESREVFDTTSGFIARENKIFDENASYGPVIVCIGKRYLIPGLDKQLVGKETGSKQAFRIASEEAFGKKNAKLIQLVSTAKFRQQQLVPFPGMQVNIDGVVGTVKAVTGGRTIVDFNHPLSGRELEYEVTVIRIVTDLAEKVKAVLKFIGIRPEAVKVSVTPGSAVLEFPEKVPEQLKKEIEGKLKSTICGLDSVSFSEKENSGLGSAPKQ